MLLPSRPDTEDLIFDGALELQDPEPGAVQRAIGRVADPAEIARLLPQVSIGQPEAWPIEDLYRRAGTTPPSLTQAMLERYDLYLIRLACSFRPERGHSRVDWARFELTLEPDDQGNQPLAEDLHPDVVDTEQKAHTKAVIGPSVKFEPVEVSVGSLEIGFEHTKLLPRISASGQFEANPAWDYFRVPGHEIVGGKSMHLIAKAPRGMLTVTGTISLTADIETTSGIIRAVLRPRPGKVATKLPVRLWPKRSTG